MRRAQDRARSATIEYYGARSVTIESRALGVLKLAREARKENVPAKRADFFIFVYLPTTSIDKFLLYDIILYKEL